MAVAFLVTEIVECAMLRNPVDGVEIALRRQSDLTARLSLTSPVLVPDGGDDPGQVQFERILAGLARQLRSPLDRKLGPLHGRPAGFSRKLNIFESVPRANEIIFKWLGTGTERRAFMAWIATFAPPLSLSAYMGPEPPTPPPPGGDSGPKLRPGPSIPSEVEAASAAFFVRAARQWVRRMARIANS